MTEGWTRRRSWDMLLVMLLLAVSSAFLFVETAATEWVVGGENIGWSTGANYRTMLVKPGDTLKFKWSLGSHDLWQMPDDGCDWSEREGLLMLADTSDSPTVVTILPEHVDAKQLFFACSIGAHCFSGGQNLVVDVVEDYDLQEAIQRNVFNAGGGLGGRSSALTSSDEGAEMLCDLCKRCEPCASAACKDVTTGVCQPCAMCSRFNSICDACSPMDRSDGDFAVGAKEFLSPEMGSCDEPVPVPGEPGVFTTSCISPPVPMAPGEVVDSMVLLASPYPEGRTVRWLGTEPDIVRKVDNGNGGEQLVSVPLSELYVHHFTGGVEGLGEGAEYRGDSWLPLETGPGGEKWALTAGSEGRRAVACNFHLIDIRGVEDWLPCIECRCQDGSGNYLNVGGANEEDAGKGGIYCCDTCPSTSTGGVVDYFLTYTVKWGELEPDTAVVHQLSLDAARALDRKVEHDVVPWMAEAPGSENVTVVWRGALTANNGLAGDGSYTGPKTVRLLGCKGHQHVGGRGMRLINENTGEEICHADTVYGTEVGVPGNEKDFVVRMQSMDMSWEPIELPHDLPVRLESIYENALHVGVMSLFRMYYDSGETGQDIMA